MKKGYYILFILSLCTLLFSCGNDNTLVVEHDKMILDNGTVYTINDTTLSDGVHTYSYEVSANDDLTITYPDGGVYHESSGGAISYDGTPSDEYSDSFTLSRIINQHLDSKKLPHNLPAVIVLFILGIFNLALPELSWTIYYGWRFKDAEPSDAALIIERIAGALSIIAAILLIFN